MGRGANGQFKASDDVTLSLKRDRHGRQAEGDKQAGRLERHVRCSSSSRTDSDVPVRYWLLWCFRHYCSSSCAGAAVRQTPSDARQSSGRHERSRTHVGLGKDTPTRVLHSRDALCGLPGGLTRVAGLWRRHDLRVVSTCRQPQRQKLNRAPSCAVRAPVEVRIRPKSGEVIFVFGLL